MGRLLLLRLARFVRHFKRSRPHNFRHTSAAKALRANLHRLVTAVRRRDFHSLQVRLERTSGNARHLGTDAAQVLFLTARRNLISKLPAFATNFTLPSHRSPRSIEPLNTNYPTDRDP